MHLPEELVTAILANVYYKNPPFSDPDYSTLAACSLVNSLWTSPAQTLLFRRIQLGVAHAFSRSLANIHNPALLSHVRVLSVALSDKPLLRIGGGESTCPVSTLVSILERCPKLYELSISSRGLFWLGLQSRSDIMAVIQTNSLSIRSLRILECSVQSPILYELLALFPAIQFLTLGVEIAASPPSWTPMHNFYELSLHRTPSSEILSWLLSASEISLRILELRDLPSVHTQADLARHCPHIQSLRLMRYNAHTAAILRQCTNLSELVLLNVPTLISLPDLPPSLEHFAFVIQTHSASVDLRPVINAVSALPHLRILSFVGDPQLDQIPMLKSACDAKGAIMRQTTTHRFWVTEDPVMTTRFPGRRQSVSNFYLMN
ncbi:hypothetical protein B0H10DRAFT_1881385 [Mycena sp. CBHHK59/15]|nr:hypothetical protein B0H10DRAFT_1881385 [Mycena sp. CBHHK59/15]